jgi:DNA repair exonuclease SbcCD ATPase subunit
MSEATLESPKTVLAFGKRNANQERIEQEEKELKELTSRTKEEVKPEEQEDDSSLPVEEKTFKKRYGDLRRHSQQMQNDLQKQIDDLKNQLEQSTKKQIALPKSEEELAEWAKQYPDVAKIVETIAIKKAKEQSEAIEQRFKALDEREQQTAREKAEAELMRLHPDFDEIRNSDEFHNWVEAQPKWIQNSLYENDTDAISAARAIDLYKADMKKNNAKNKSSSDKEAARSIGMRNARSAPADTDMEGVFYESQIEKMSAREYEANQEAIVKAMQSGKFIYDLSGSAR